MGMHETWELIHQNSNVSKTLRLEVPGGWLYLYMPEGTGAYDNRTMVFVPNPKAQFAEQFNALLETPNLKKRGNK